jgi:uncharacterized membrane protein HdeD (DUF308 family)
MLATLSKNWWVVLIRGIASIIFGLLALFMPGLTLFLLVALFAAYVLVDGAGAIFTSFASRDTDSRWWWHLIEGSLGVIAGLLTLLWPGIAAITFVLVIGAWAALTGIMQIATAIRLRREIKNEWLLLLSGAISLLFGVYVFLFPGAGALALAWLVGLYALFFGITWIGLALRLRSHHQHTNSQTPQAA